MSQLDFAIFKGIAQSKKHCANLVDLHIKIHRSDIFNLSGVLAL